MILVGSRLCNPANRDVTDFDWLCTKEQWKHFLKANIQAGANISSIRWKDDKGLANIDGTWHEGSYIDHPNPLRQSDAQMYKLFRMWPDLSTELCFLMKWSHRFKKNSPHFEKTRSDIAAFEREYPGIRERVLNHPVLGQILKEREAATYTNNLPKLNTTKENFFTDNVPYVYDHDTIHKAVKHMDKPAYQYYMKEGEQVMCDKDKWEALPPIIKLYGVLEESYVLAIERAIVPFNTDHYKAFKIALEKVCTSITSGWFREFAWEHYFTVLNMYDSTFVDKFNAALSEGKIALYAGGYKNGT